MPIVKKAVMATSAKKSASTSPEMLEADSAKSASVPLIACPAVRPAALPWRRRELRAMKPASAAIVRIAPARTRFRMAAL